MFYVYYYEYTNNVKCKIKMQYKLLSYNNSQLRLNDSDWKCKRSWKHMKVDIEV